MAAPFGGNPGTSAPSGASGEGSAGAPGRGPGRTVNVKQAPHQRPGGLPGSTSGAEGDNGRDGLTEATPDRQLPPHTGY